MPGDIGRGRLLAGCHVSDTRSAILFSTDVSHPRVMHSLIQQVPEGLGTTLF